MPNFKCKYGFDQLAIVMMNEFDEKHGFIGHKILHGTIDAVTFTNGLQPQYRLIHDEGHEWQSEEEIRPINATKGSDHV